MKSLLITLLLFVGTLPSAFAQSIYQGGSGGGFASTGPIAVVSSMPDFVAIYPNPVSAPAPVLQLFSKYTPIASFQIIDSYDKVEFSLSNLPPKTLNLSVVIGRLSPGFYLAKLRLSNGKIFLQKLVRQ